MRARSLRVLVAGDLTEPAIRKPITAKTSILTSHPSLRQSLLIRGFGRRKDYPGNDLVSSIEDALIPHITFFIMI